MVLLMLNMPLPLVHYTVMTGLVTYYIYIFFIKENRPFVNEVPKAIVTIILSIMVIILPFWFLVGWLFEPTSFILIGATGILDYVVNMNPFTGGEGSGEGNNGGNSEPGGNIPGDQPPKGGVIEIQF